MFPQSWPHAHLQYEYVNKQITYDELDFKMFIVVKIEIICLKVCPDLRDLIGRTSVLKKIIY